MVIKKSRKCPNVSFFIKIHTFDKRLSFFRVHFPCKQNGTMAYLLQLVMKIYMFFLFFFSKKQTPQSKLSCGICTQYVFCLLSFCNHFPYPASQMSYCPSSLLVSAIAKGAVQLLHIRIDIINYTMTIDKGSTTCIFHIAVQTTAS